MIRRVILLHSALCILHLLVAVPASAQQRPLQTEDPETIGSGRILIEAGLDYNRDVYYPLSGLRGNLFSVPTLGISLGVSSIAETSTTKERFAFLEREAHAIDGAIDPASRVKVSAEIRDFEQGHWGRDWKTE